MKYGVRPVESKRKFTRVECNSKSAVEIGNVAVVEANIMNISLDGVLFELKHECLFNKGEKWHLKFKLPDSVNVGQFETEVMHSHGNRVGMKFVHMDPDTRMHLCRLLEVKTNTPQKAADETLELQGHSVPSS